MPTATAEYRAVTPRAVWMTARARNALRRRVFVATLTAGAIVSVIVALVIVPLQARRMPATTTAHQLLPDTTPLVAQIASAQASLRQADSELTVSRANAQALSAVAVDSASPAQAARRDSLRTTISSLETLLDRVENAPLTASYRALGESPTLAGDARVRALLDSLNELDRERETFGATGGADPVFVALTSRANDIGRAIQAIAVERRNTLQQQVFALTPVVRQPTPQQLAAADTVGKLVQAATAEANLRTSMASLADARQRRAELEARADEERQAAALKAPPLALLAAALVLGAFVGFGVALFRELRNPRIADEREAERIAGVRVLATIVPTARPRERQRRRADKVAPPLLDPGAAGHQLVYLHAATSSPPLLMVTVTGDDAAVTGAVASNFAAVAAEEARNTVLVDADNVNSPVANVLHLRVRPGLADVVAGRAEISEVAQQAVTGRDRTIDVVASGVGAELDGERLREYFARESTRFTRYYDAVVVASTEKQARAGAPAALPIADVIYCARIGLTRLGYLRQAIDALTAAGCRPIGIVLWKAPFPRFARGDSPIEREQPAALHEPEPTPA